MQPRLRPRTNNSDLRSENLSYRPQCYVHFYLPIDRSVGLNFINLPKSEISDNEIHESQVYR
jgi:hypothetical protein